MTRLRKPPVNVPAVIAAAGDRNRSLARWKASLAKRWSLTRMGELFEAVELAWCVLALGREQETQAIVHAMGVVPFGGDYNIWTPVGYALCLQARLARLAGDTPSWEAMMARLRAHPVTVTNNPAAVRQVLNTLPGEIEQGAQDRSLVFARKRLGTVLMELNYFQECGLAGIDHGVAYAPQALEAPLHQALERLRTRLEAGSPRA